MPPVVAILKRMLAAVAGAAVFQVLSPSITFAAPPQEVSLVCADTPAKPVQHGLSKFKLVFQQKRVVVEEAPSLEQATGKHLLVIGLTSGTSEAARLITELQLLPGKETESLLIRKLRHEGKDVLLVAGSDARRLMFALLMQMAHDRGLMFAAGIWDHIYRGGIAGADDLQR